MAKNQQNGLTQPLDSEATKNSQPTKLFIPGAEDITWANPVSPSTNNATRREKYNIDQGNTVPESIKIGSYSTVSPTLPKVYTPSYIQQNWDASADEYMWYIKKLTSYSYNNEDTQKRLEEIQRALAEDWYDTTKGVYGQYATDAAKQVAQLDMQLGQLKAQKNRISNTQSSNAEVIYALAKEVWMWLSMWESVQDIAKKLWQEERVIQKIANNQEEELVQLNADYEQEQMRSYLRNREDMDTQIMRNITQFQNTMTNMNYQFDSAMKTLERSMFDAERAAKTSSAIYWMTGTQYTLDRIKTQYQQQMNDLQNTFDYQSANVQMAINNALEDYYTNIQRRAEDYEIERKWLQGYVLQNLQNIQNNIWLTNDQITSSLLTLKSNVEAAQSNAMIQYMSALENWNTALQNAIANAYGLSDMWAGTGTMRTERNNNPTAMTTDVAKSLWAVEWVDYIQWDSFKTSSGWTLYTARLLGDPIETTIKIFDNAAEKWIPIFYTKKWGQRWSYIAMTNDQWKALTQEQKENVIRSMLQHEWWNMSAMSYYKQNWTASTTEWEWWQATYDKAYTKDYDRYLTNWRDSFKKSTQEALIQQFWSMDNFIKNAQEYSEAVIQPQQAQTFQNSLDILVEFNKAWNKLNDRQRWLVKKLWVKDSYQSWLYSDEVNNAVNLYKQLMAQWFIQNIIDSKKKWATYGPLSDNEWGKIQDAYSSMKLNAPEYVQGYIDYMMYDLSTAITELWWTPDVESWLQRDISYLYNNLNTQSEFNTPGSAYTWAGSVNNWTNSQWAYQSWTVNTWATQMWWN